MHRGATASCGRAATASCGRAATPSRGFAACQRAARTCRPADHRSRHCRRTRRELASGLPGGTGAAAAGWRDHIGFDGQTHRGQLIVHEELVSQVITIFEQLYELRYPIEKIRTVDQYPAASDELQMEDNNTSAFSYRDIPGSGRWSQHAYGRAIDVNPLFNPYATGAFQPKHVSLVPWLRSTAGNRARLNRVSPRIQIGQRPRGRVDTDVWPAAPS